MRIIPTALPALPPLAWLAVAEPKAGTVHVTHGPLVEVREQFFVEGTWDGAFSEGDIAETDCFFGSGAVLSNEGIAFISSGATTDYLYHRTEHGITTVANSLPLLLAQLGDRLDPRVPNYSQINYSIILGIDHYERDIPTARGQVHRLMYRNLHVSAAGAREYDKRLPPRFPTYESYQHYVASAYRRIATNARDAGRRVALSIVSTQSRGYDTTAVNATAAPFVVDTAYTVQQGKPAGAFANDEHGESANDDGTEICGMLGIPCVPIDRRSFERDFTDEYLFYATLDDNQDVNLRDITRQAGGAAILLTGTLGELWYTRKSYEGYMTRYGLIDDQLKRVDLGCHGLTEVRLLAGLVHLPFPYIGARRREDIFRVTESRAMDPWRLDNSYDRPIPRRMAEEAGLPRESFGQTKIATVVEFAPPPMPQGATLRREYLDFLRDQRLLASWKFALVPTIHRINAVLWFASEQRYPAVHYLQRAISKLLRREFRFALRWRHLSGRLFCFCANKRADEYARALADAREGSA